MNDELAQAKARAEALKAQYEEALAEVAAIEKRLPTLGWAIVYEMFRRIAILRLKSNPTCLGDYKLYVEDNQMVIEGPANTVRVAPGEASATSDKQYWITFTLSEKEARNSPEFVYPR